METLIGKEMKRKSDQEKEGRKEGGKEDANNIFMFLVIYTRHEY